jgi:pilus assembly protein Flp/PilA
MLNERGARAQGLIEYALIIILVAMIVMLVLVLLAPPIANVYSNIISSL